MLKEEAIEEPSTKVVAEHFDVRVLEERTTSTHVVDQNRIGYTTNKLDLAEIRDRRVDQEPEINIRDCIWSGVSFLYSLKIVLGSWKSYLVKWV